MTLKRSIAYLMIVAMLLGKVPNTYYAASFNHVNKVLTVMNGETLLAGEAPILNISLIDELEEGAIFYIELAGGKWLETLYTSTLKGHTGSGSLEIKRLNTNKLQVKVKGEALEQGTTLQIPLQLRMTAEEAEVTIKSNNTVISAGKYTVAYAESYKGTVISSNIPTTTDSGIMADLIIEEPFSRAFSKAVKIGKSNVIEVRLNHNGYGFSLADSNVQFIPSQGFEELSVEDFKIKQTDAQTLEITLPNTDITQYTGAFTLSGVYIQLLDKVSECDRLTVTVSGDLIETSTLEVLEVMDYAIALKGNSQTVRAGSRQTVSFILEEQVEHSLVRNRPTYFTFTSGVKLEAVNGKVPVYVNGELGYYSKVIEDGDIVGFEISRLPEGQASYEIVVEAIVMPKAIGDIQLIAEGRSLIENLRVSILNAYQPFKTAINTFDALVGVKDQIGGQVMIQETGAGEFIAGEKIVLSLEESNIKYSGIPEILVTSGDLRLGTATIRDNCIEIPIIRSSHTASTVVVRDFKVTVDQTIASGAYTLQVGGGAFSTLATADDLMPIAEGTLIQVVEAPVEGPVIPNDEENETELPKMQVTFTLGKTTYQIGEVIKSMDATPYASNGRTMLPIKYVSEALGISQSDIHWNQQTKTVTIYTDETITLKLGSPIMTINDENITMSAVPEAINGRTFIPVAEITRALKVETNWDHVSKQVSFMV